MMVDRWCAAEWEEAHNAAREQRLMMPGAPHHQENLSLQQYATPIYLFLSMFLFFLQSTSYGGQPCSQLKAWALAQKGKATSNVDYSPEDPASAFTNATVHSRLSEYSLMAKEVHGDDFDPLIEDIDGEVIMRIGGEKKHGRYNIGANTLDASNTPTLSQIRARSTSSSPAIHPRPTVQQVQMEALQVIFVSFVVH
jgi:hypothetical protein